MCTNENLHLTKLHAENCTDKSVNLSKCEMCICRNLHCAEICICRKVCAADLRILCTTVFAHLQICAFVFCACAEVCEHVKMFLHIVHVCENILQSVRICEIVFFHFWRNLQIWAFFAKSVEKVEISENVPKMSEKSSRVPEWYTSGSWANAFDNTGWQKSPEYALIRIAAGAPDLAKSGQIRPRTAPDGKSSRIWRRFAFAPRAEILSGAVFSWHAHRSPIRRLVPEARRVLRQSPTHSANVRTLRKTLAENRRQGSGHSAHCAHRAQPKPTHVHKLCTPKHRRAHLCTTAPQLPTQVAENTSSMCCSFWGRREVRSVHEQ